jgi:hypothetical protein
MIWADVDPLSCFGTHDGTTAEAAVVNGLGLPQLQEMMHAFVSGLIEKKLLAEGAVVVVLGKAPWSCCEELDSLLPKLDVHQVDHPMYTGMWARAHSQEARTPLAIQALNNGEKWSLFVLELAASPSIGNGASPLSDGRPLSPYVGEHPRGGEGADSRKNEERKVVSVNRY